MEEKHSQSVLEKMDVITRLLAANLVGDKSQTDAIRQLGRMGLDRNLIADVTGAAPATVSVRLSEAKKKGRSIR